MQTTDFTLLYLQNDWLETEKVGFRWCSIKYLLLSKILGSNKCVGIFFVNKVAGPF